MFDTVRGESESWSGWITLKVLVFLSSDSRSCVSWRIRQQGTKDSAGRLGAVWHKVNRWNQRAKFRWVSRLFSLVYILSCYRIIDFNCKLCTVCSSSFWSINSQITRLVIWGETYSDKRVDDAQSGELPNHIVCLSLSLSFNFVNFVDLINRLNFCCSYWFTKIQLVLAWLKLFEHDTSNRPSSSFWYCQRGRDLDAQAKDE